MTLIPTSMLPTQTHSVSAPAKAKSALTSPRRLDIGSIQNQLFGGTGKTPNPTMTKPTSEIRITLLQFRPKNATTTPRPPRVAQHCELTKQVRFAEHHTKETVDSSFRAMTARVGVDLTALGRSQCLMENGDSLPASMVKNQLLMCLNWNRDEALVSARSKPLLREAFYEACTLPGKAACRPGDYPYDVLSVFLDVVEQKHPALLASE